MLAALNACLMAHHVCKYAALCAALCVWPRLGGAGTDSLGLRQDQCIR